MDAVSNYSVYFGEIVRQSFSRFLYAYSRDDLREEYQEVRRAVKTSGFPHRRRRLVKRLRACGIPCEDQEPLDSLQKKVEQAPDRDELIGRLIRELDRLWREFPSPADHMEHTVRKLGDPDLQDASVRLTILRHFLRYGPKNDLMLRRLAQRKYGDRIPAKADAAQLALLLRDDIFDVLDGPLTKDDRKKYEILICADDLARGRFRQQGKAKMDLYRFAFAFGMTASIPGREPVPDRDRDITVRLFEDYYQNNILRYLADQSLSAGGRASDGSEAEPVGDGINPKNFAEAIFVYHLRKEGLSRFERYDSALKMIDRCMAIAAERGGTAADTDLEFSKDYWELLMDGAWDLEPEDMVRFICDRYEIPRNAGSRSRIAVAWEGRTALAEYVKILCGLSYADGFLGKRVDEGLFGGGIDRYLQQKGLTVAPELYRLLQQMDRCLSLELPEAQTIRAALLEDQGDPELGAWVLLPCVYMEALDSLLRWPLGSPSSVTALRQEVKGLKEGTQDPRLRAMADRMLCLLRDHGALCDRICDRIRADREALDRLRADYQRGLLDLGRPLVWWPEVTKALSRSRQLADRSAATVEEAETLRAALQACRTDMEQLLRQMSPYGPESEKVARRCLAAVDACAVARAVEVLPKTGPFLQALIQTLEGFGEGTPDLVELAPVARPLSVDPEKILKGLQERVARLHRISRTQMIAMACLSYVDDTGGERRSMPDMLQDLKQSIDETLTRCRFQPISEKNLFDMLIVFELYLSLTLGQG